ncbi:MAG: AAA family ATPase [Bacteroidales bacterium]|nr:AAA family ATPase [Bacteroidales bacterium]
MGIFDGTYYFGSNNNNDNTLYSKALKATEALMDCYKAMDNNKQVKDALLSQPQLKAINHSEFPSIFKTKSIAVLAFDDLHKVFKGLGQDCLQDDDEGLILGIMLLRLFMSSEKTWENESLTRMAHAQGITTNLYDSMRRCINIEYDPDRFLLIDLLRTQGVDEEFVHTYAVRLYQFATLIAQADNEITPKEKEWLAQILAISDGTLPPPSKYFHPKEHPGDEAQKEEEAEQQTEIIEHPMEELKALIGLENVKKEVQNIYNLVKIQKIRSTKGLKTSSISYHCVFTGNPGTGKTTVARLIAQIYRELGVLKKGHLVETDRSGLVAEYVGQTAVKTNRIIDTALDGVLFIDEAYALLNPAREDFGAEAIATLLKRMEDNRNRLVVILAGYSDRMTDFINSNPGLQSRFNRYIHFDDYSVSELMEIYKYNLEKFDYKLTDMAYLRLLNTLAQAVASKDKNFGNARFVRNLFEKTLERQANRLAVLDNYSEEDLSEILPDDIPE